MNLIHYRGHVLTLIPYFKEITFDNIPQEDNQLADALATMLTMLKVRWENEAPRITIERLDELAHCYEVDVDRVEEKPWFHEVRIYLEAQE